MSGFNVVALRRAFRRYVGLALVAALAATVGPSSAAGAPLHAPMLAPTHGDPPSVPAPGACLGLEVRSLRAPSSLGPGGTGTAVAIIDNPNPADTCDDGAFVRMTFNGTVDAVKSVGSGPGFVCSVDDPHPFAYAHRCVASEFGGAASATLTFSVVIPDGSDRIAVEARTLQGGEKVALRPGKANYLDATVNLPVASAGPAPATKPQAAPPAATALPTLRIGANGAQVTALQHLLAHHGQEIGVDGDFGPQTQQGVRAFQQANGLTVDGVVGPQTWNALLVDVRRADQGESVRALQTLLNRHGQDIVVDGDFGEQTDGAVRKFQDARKLTVDGVVGQQTWTALLGAR